MSVLKSTVCLLTLCATGCATSGRVIDTGCSWVRPIMVSKQDVLTDGTASQILTHNETWQRVCEPAHK
jgi:hypothetical protein